MSLPDWLATPALKPTWARLRARLESTGRTARGKVTLTLSSREERHAVGALLGRSLTRDRVEVDLAQLDSRLAARSGVGGLSAVVELVSGEPLRDRPAERADLTRRREEPLRVGRELLSGPWVDQWLDGLRSAGLLTSRPDAVEIMSDAAKVLAHVTEGESVLRSRVDLGARLLGDSHALDEDRLQHLIVLRGLAAAAGTSLPAAAEDRRALWKSFGIEPDLVSSTCLTLGLRPAGDDPVSVRLRTASAAGDPLHLTGWDLRRWTPSQLPKRSVLICENPRVLEAIAESSRGDTPVVCTSGEPNMVVLAVLEQLAAAGCDLRYHGDFDWPGIAIANRLIRRFTVEPWLMTAADYEAGVSLRSPALIGPQVEPLWDTDLAAALRHRGVAVHEEAVLDPLLSAL